MLYALISLLMRALTVVEVDRLTPPAGEDQGVITSPCRACAPPFRCLLTAMLSQDLHSAGIDADDTRPAALGSPFDALTLYDVGRSPEGDFASVEINRFPPEIEQHSAARAGVGSQMIKRV